uniref:Uncharacterized protein n=1 Tax=Cacopsylla melanoneura TaxID=428564 RepID=A0A8D8UH96_9HEMI
MADFTNMRAEKANQLKFSHINQQDFNEYRNEVQAHQETWQMCSNCWGWKEMYWLSIGRGYFTNVGRVRNDIIIVVQQVWKFIPGIIANGLKGILLDEMIAGERETVL